MGASGDVAATPQARLALGIADVFVNVVVLNLAAEWVPSVISESFSMSILTALLLKGVLEIVLAVKRRVLAALTSAQTVPGKVVAAVGLWLVMVGSKFLVLESVALIFRDRVSLGGFWAVTGLVITLVLARAAVRRGLTAVLSAEQAVSAVAVAGSPRREPGPPAG